MVAALGAIGALLGGAGGAATVVGKLAEAIFPIVDRLIPDPDKKQKLMTELLDTLGKFDLGQLDVNRVEAAHPSVFVAGWRPFIGWVLGVGIGYSFLIAPVVGGLVSLWRPGFAMPVVDDHLWELVFAMLGMGALRSFDKLRDIDTRATKQKR